MRSFAIHLILIGLLNVTSANIVEAQKASNSLPIDTFYFKFVKSSHFKIKLPKIEDSATYKDLFNTYGKLSTVKIKGKQKQFLGDFKNVSRAKYVNGVLNKAGITNTSITLFDIWVPPVIKKPEPKVASQTAITDEANNKVKGKEKRKTSANTLNSEKTNPFPARPKNIDDDAKAANTKNNIVSTKETENIADKKAPGKKTSGREMSNNNIAGEKKEQSKIDDIKDDIKIEKKKAGEYILILPKVANPEVYQFVLKDLGTVEYKKLPNDQWYYYVGFFNNQEAAKAILPKIKERGFKSPAKITNVNNAEKIALTMYKNLPPIETKKSTSNKKNNPEKIDKSLFYRIELPPVSNPEIYLKAFEDIGANHSEISPNGKGVYYIGEFQTVEIAKAKVVELKQRGLNNGVIVKFKNDERIDAYAEIYTKVKEEAIAENVKEKEEEKVILVKTHPKGNFQIRLKQVENPDVLKWVFEDVGKLKVGYLEDDTEYYFMGNYLFQKDAEKVIEQLKIRGLTKFDLLNIMASGYNNEGKQEKNDIVNVESKNDAKSDLSKDTLQKNIPVNIENSSKAKADLNKNTEEANQILGEKNIFKVKLAISNNPKFYENILKHYGEITSNNNNEYFIGDYPTKEVAEMVIEQLREIGIETPLEVVPF